MEGDINDGAVAVFWPVEAVEWVALTYLKRM